MRVLLDHFTPQTFKMTKIEIIGSSDDGSLEFMIDGKYSMNGSAKIYKKGLDWTKVRWGALHNSGVASIKDIKMKSGPGNPPSTNIFIQGPDPQGSAPSKTWTGTVKSNVAAPAEYNYYIEWVSDDDGHTRICDPKISIMPSLISVAMRIIISVVAALGLFSMFLLLNKKVKR
jgi:hypothetical protein